VSEELMAENRVALLASSLGKANEVRKTHLVEMVVLGSVLFAATGHLLIKSGLNSLRVAGVPSGLVPRLMGYLLAPAVTGGLLIYGIGTALWVFAVSKREISYLFPLSALNYVVVALGGKWLFGESILATRWIGILVVVGGVWLMQRWGAEESQ
jgi:drug/metabolite transporter (DMT)-like permease